MNKKIVGILICMLFIGTSFSSVHIVENVKADINNDLVGYWNFDEGSGTTAHDSSGNGYDGSIYGASWTTGISGGALEFDANSDRVVFSSPVLNTPPYSVCVWANPTTTSSHHYIISNGGQTRDAHGFYMSNSYNMWRFGGYKDDGYGGGANTPIQESGWTFICGTWDGSTSGNPIKNYVNGNLREEGIIGHWNNGPDQNLRIGSPSNYASSYGFFGSIDEVRIYNRVLSPNEIWNLYGGESNPPTIPTNPNPSLGATGVDVNTEISWTCTDPDPGDTLTYDVYFGTSSNPPKVSTNQISNSYNPLGALNYLTKYYWKIVAKDNHGESTSGPIWYFTTSNIPNDPPTIPSKPSGPSYGNTGTMKTFYTSSTDPDNDQIRYGWDWGDGSSILWSAKYDSGDICEMKYQWDKKGIYNIRVKAKDSKGAVSDDWSEVKTIEIYYVNNDPFDPLQPSGPNSGNTDETYTYLTTAIDPDGNQISYGWDWNGDKVVDEWSDLFPSGLTVTREHSWYIAGTYNVQVMAEDEYGGQSGWSPVLPVEITGGENPPPIAKIDYINPNIANRKIAEMIQFKGHAEYPGEDDEVKITEWEMYSKTEGGLIFCGSSPYYEDEIEYEFPATWLKKGIHKVKFRVKDLYGIWSEWSDACYLEIVNCDWLIRAPYSEPSDEFYAVKWSSGVDYQAACAFLDTGIFGIRIEDDGGMITPICVRMGGKVNTGSNKVVKGTARISYYGANTGWSEGRLRITADSFYRLTKDNPIPGLEFWKLEVILDFVEAALFFIPNLNPFTIQWLIEELFQEFFVSLGDIISYNSFKSALLNEGNYQTFSLTSYKVPTGGNNAAWFMAQVEADNKIKSGELFVNGVFDYIKVNECSGPADPINIGNNCKTEIEVVDPAGRIINQTFSDIPGATYSEYDLDDDGEADNLVTIPTPINGIYKIHVIPWDNASQVDIFSLKIYKDNQEIILADNVSIADIPDTPYSHEAVSTNPPFIKILYPTGGEMINDTITIEWNASDYEDNNDLPISIFYSMDSENWTMIADKIFNTGVFSWNTLTIPDGSYMLKVETTDSFGNIRDDKSDFMLIENNEIPQNNNPPLIPVEINGETKGGVDKLYSYSTTTYDIENDEFFYIFDWGDSSNSGWLGPYLSNVTVDASHFWTEKGNYEIKVKVKDIHGYESNWSEPLEVTMPKNKATENIFLSWFLQNFFHRFPLFEKILNLFY